MCTDETLSKAELKRFTTLMCKDEKLSNMIVTIADMQTKIAEQIAYYGERDLPPLVVSTAFVARFMGLDEFSKIIGADEAGTIDYMSGKRPELNKKASDEIKSWFKGRIVKTEKGEDVQL